MPCLSLVHRHVGTRERVTDVVTGNREAGTDADADDHRLASDGDRLREGRFKARDELDGTNPGGRQHLSATTANSSPPRRATVSTGRVEAVSR